jgi:hypothetical protein
MQATGRDVMTASLPLTVSPYPSSALSAGQLASIAVVAVLTLAAWLTLVFAVGRQPQHRGATGTSLLQQPPVREPEREQPEGKAA